MIKTAPAIFAVGNDYQIMVEVQQEAFVYVKVGEKTYYDETNGIMNSLLPIHRVIVPMEELDQAKQYTLVLRPVVERKPYFTQTVEPLEFPFAFRPVPRENIRIYHISDAHNHIDRPVAAAQTFGQIDLLILNGDIIDHSGDPEKFHNIYAICAALTGGNIPVIFSRGNHDMRGKYAEKFADYTPAHLHKTYYTFRLGSLWGILLDCGEDKDDSRDEYGFTVACHGFRQRQTDFIKDVIAHAEEEYNHKDVTTKLVIAHNPFTQRLEEPFDIEEDIYSQWAALLKDHVKPNLMICGHLHTYGINPVGCSDDHLGQPCTVVIGSRPTKDFFIGCGLIVTDDHIEVQFTDSLGNTLSTHLLNK